MRIGDSQLASGLASGVAHADERADAGAVQERNPGEVHDEDCGSLIPQQGEQLVAEYRCGCQVDLSGHAEPGRRWLRMTCVDG
ncbi:hypothetical protein R6Y94_28070 [Plantactinospora sp. KLBMP9567]|nr:hypothetical protein [Plantactinospora sp. KLBMP9567]MDW5327662.1 hypothetical protein [Plantactinospora sp. KLBMP9567]